MNGFYMVMGTLKFFMLQSKLPDQIMRLSNFRMIRAFDNFLKLLKVK